MKPATERLVQTSQLAQTARPGLDRSRLDTDILPEQTSDDCDPPGDGPDPADLRRFLDERPPHHRA